MAACLARRSWASPCRVSPAASPFVLPAFSQGKSAPSITLRSWLALGYLIVFGSGLGFTAYIYLLKNTAAARVGTYALVNPVVALFLGWLFVGESITLRTGLAAGVILTAVLLVITAPHRDAESAKLALPES